MNVYTEFDLSQILWYKIGGKAQYFIEVKEKEDVLRALDFAEKHGVKRIFVIGYGSNLLFTDKFFDGAIFRIIREENDLISLANISGEVVVDTFAGESLDRVIQFAFANSLVGLEWAGGLPGTVGAAIRGNVGAFGSEIKDVVYKVEALRISDTGFDIQHFAPSDLQFSYRNSFIKQNKNLIVTGVIFKFARADGASLEQAKQVYENNIAYRKEKHPLEYPNCGSVFKNITDQSNVAKVLEIMPNLKTQVESQWHGKVSMGYLIGELGLSGLKNGGAQVSEKHPNFIINLGGATFADVTEIIDRIKVKFVQAFGFTPETEVEIVTF